MAVGTTQLNIRGAGLLHDAVRTEFARVTPGDAARDTLPTGHVADLGNVIHRTSRARR